MAVSVRMRRLRARLGPDGALLVTNLTNVRYLTGFTGSAGMLFVLPDRSVLLTDGRYESQAEEQLAACGAEVEIAIAPTAGQRERAIEILAGVRRLGLEAAHISWARQRTMARDWFPGTELEPTEGLIEQLR